MLVLRLLKTKSSVALCIDKKNILRSVMMMFSEDSRTFASQLVDFARSDERVKKARKAIKFHGSWNPNMEAWVYGFKVIKTT